MTSPSSALLSGLKKEEERKLANARSVPDDVDTLYWDTSSENLAKSGSLDSGSPKRRNSRKGSPSKTLDRVLQERHIVFDKYAVDLFRKKSEFRFMGINTFFLSHAHSDHTGGLCKTWDLGTIYCTQITADLASHMLGVDPKWFRILKTDGNFVPFAPNLSVAAIDANHCPGAAMFVFKKEWFADEKKKETKTEIVVHTGDFRYIPNPLWEKVLGGHRVDRLIVDTTFCDPEYTFPSQDDAEMLVVNHIRVHDKKALFFIGTYKIGKEKIALRVGKELGKKVFVPEDKMELFRFMGFTEEEMAVFTTDPSETNVQIASMMDMSCRALEAKYGNASLVCDSLIGFKPTGWCWVECSSKYNMSFRRSGKCSVVGIPYSEHCSFNDLRDFVAMLDPVEIVPFVDVNGASKDEVIARLRGGKKPEPADSISKFFSKEVESKPKVEEQPSSVEEDIEIDDCILVEVLEKFEAQATPKKPVVKRKSLLDYFPTAKKSK